MSRVQPTKRRPGYANLAIAEPPLELVLIQSADARGSGIAGAPGDSTIGGVCDCC